MAMCAHERCGDELPGHDDDLAQQSVLALLLDAYPALRSTEEVVRQLADRPAEFAERDRIDNAIRDLVGAGLLHRHGSFLFATRAAMRFHELGT